MIVEDPQENYHTGYIKLFRSIKNKGWYLKSDFVHLWIHILIKANHKGNEWMYKNTIFKVKRGQFVTSRKTLSSETGINQSKIERILKCFESEQQIEQQNLYTSRLLSVLNYENYQTSEQQTNSKRTASEQQVNTNNNVNNDKNVIYKEFAFFDDEFSSVWKDYLSMRKTIKKPATNYAEKLALKQLSKISSDNKIVAIDIVNQSIMNSWQGLFELKKNGHANTSDRNWK